MYSPDLFEGQVALVTGGAGGIGKAVADALQACGAQVVAADLNLDNQDMVQDSKFESCHLDVTSKQNVVECLAAVKSKFGRIDILVNVAGVVSLGKAQSLQESEWDQVININLKGTFLSCQAVIPYMREQGYGRIINIGSVIGKNGGNPRPWLDPDEQENASNIAYGVSKAGINAITAFLAKELASFGVTVNTVAPGPIASAMTHRFPQSLINLIPVGRMGTGNDVASAVLFLAARQSSFITGETLDVNGGIWCD